MTACRLRQHMAVQPGCSCRTFIFGKAGSGCGDYASWKATSPVSGSRWATTFTAIPGKNSDMTETEAAAAPARRLAWQVAEVRDIVAETPRVKSIVLQVTGWQ